MTIAAKPCCNANSGKLLPLHTVVKMRQVNQQANLGNVKPLSARNRRRPAQPNTVVSGKAKCLSANSL